MPDTGAPWNIPYAEPSDLVRDWPALSQAVGTAVAAGLTEANIALGPNVVQTVKTDTFITTSSTYVLPTGFEVSITPSANTHKVLVIVSMPIGFNSSGAGGTPAGHMSIFRGTTNLSVPTSPGSRTPAMHEVTGATGETQVATFSFLDSPATDASVTYSGRIRAQGGSPAPEVYVNRSSFDENVSGRARTVATITAIEVAA